MNEREYYEKISERQTINCPFCNATLANDKTIVTYNESRAKKWNMIINKNFADEKIPVETCDGANVFCIDKNHEAPDDFLYIEYIMCPACEEIGIIVHRPKTEEVFRISPRTAEKPCPEYIPEQIRQDYEEACLIADLSPKASATLSRRCIQSMIRDFCGISKNRLCDEIDEAAKLPNVTELQKKALHSLRKIGNIGAHPEKDIELILDIEPGEAKLMISLIEFFIQNWYIKRHDEEEMMNEIINIAEQKDKAKNLSVQN